MYKLTHVTILTEITAATGRVVSTSTRTAALPPEPADARRVQSLRRD